MLIVKGKVIGKDVREFKYKDKNDGEMKTGRRASIFIMDGGRPQEISVHENDQFKIGTDVELPVFVSAFGTKSGGAGFRLVKVRQA